MWDAGQGAGLPERSDAQTAARKKGTLAKQPIGLRGERPAGVLRSARNRLLSTISSFEELVFLVFFLAFVGFAFYWFTLILG